MTTGSAARTTTPPTGRPPRPRSPPTRASPRARAPAAWPGSAEALPPPCWAEAAQRAVQAGAERVVLHQVRPGGGRPLQPGRVEVQAVRGDLRGPEGLRGSLL